MNTKDCNPHVGVDVGKPDGDTTAIAYGTGSVIEGVIFIEAYDAIEFDHIVQLWNAGKHEESYAFAKMMKRKDDKMRKMHIIAIVWLCIGIPALIASLAYFIWLTK